MSTRKLLIEEFKRMKNEVGKDELIFLLVESKRSPLVRNGTLRYGQWIVNSVPYGAYSNIFYCCSSELVTECGYEVAYDQENGSNV